MNIESIAKQSSPEERAAQQAAFLAQTLSQEIDERIKSAIDQAERLKIAKTKLPLSVLNLTRQERSDLGLDFHLNF